MHRVQLTTKNNNDKNSEPKFFHEYFDRSNDFSNIYRARPLPTFHRAARISHSLAYLFIVPPSRTERNHRRKRKVEKKKKKQNGGREIREGRGMEGPKKKENTPRSEWIADTAFDEINLLSDAIKYLSIQYHPSSSALLLSFFFFF